MATSNLQAIRDKVRKITLSLSPAQLTDTEIDQYINTFILYDFPETLRLFNLKTTFSFYTLPFIDTYSTTTNSASPLYDFTNKYITTDAPIYIGGYPAIFSQDRTQFYNMYPFINLVQSIGVTGNGTTNYFTGIINTQQTTSIATTNTFTILLQNNVIFDSIDSNGNGLCMQDVPILDATTLTPTNWGILYNALTTNEMPYNSITNPNGINTSFQLPHTYNLVDGIPDVAGFPTTNYINYLTGQFYVTFETAPAAGVPINSQVVPQSPSIPQALLFYDGSFVVRPVPIQSYRVDMEVWVQPTELLSADQSPEIKEWWQYIAFSAVKKVFEDRLDYDSLALIMPSLKEQEILINRRTIVQQTSKRVATIYTQQNGSNGSYNNWGQGGLY